MSILYNNHARFWGSELSPFGSADNPTPVCVSVFSSFLQCPGSRPFLEVMPGPNSAPPGVGNGILTLIILEADMDDLPERIVQFTLLMQAPW